MIFFVFFYFYTFNILGRTGNLQHNRSMTSCSFPRFERASNKIPNPLLFSKPLRESQWMNWFLYGFLRTDRYWELEALQSFSLHSPLPLIPKITYSSWNPICSKQKLDLQGKKIKKKNKLQLGAPDKPNNSINPRVQRFINMYTIKLHDTETLYVQIFSSFTLQKLF